MRAFTRCLIITLIFFCTAFGAATLFIQRHSPEPTSKIEEQGVIQDSGKSAMEFEDILSESGLTKDGFRYFYNLHKSSDGFALSVTVEKRGSSALANEELQRRIQRAVKIIERSRKLDESGQQVGERVVLISTSENPLENQAAVLWTDESDFYYIESPSLQHVLEFEKKFYY